MCGRDLGLLSESSGYRAWGCRVFGAYGLGIEEAHRVSIWSSEFTVAAA